MFHIYTYGKQSRQFLILTPKQAQTIDDFTKCFFRSQEAHLNKYGARWNPDQPIAMLVPKSDPDLLNRYNKLAASLNWQHRIRNKMFDLFRIDVSKEEFDDFLTKRV